MTTATRKYPEYPAATYDGPPMKRSVKQRWLSDLRDPNRKQGQTYLRLERRDGEVRECCLGVLLDAQRGDAKWTASKMNWGTSQAEQVMEMQSPEGYPQDTLMSKRVFQQAFVGEAKPLVLTTTPREVVDELMVWLAERNDGPNPASSWEAECEEACPPWTFLGIANWIAEYIPGQDDTDGKGGEARSQPCG